MIKDQTHSKKIRHQLLPWVAAFALFMQTLDSTILNTALPSIAKDLGESPLNLQSIIISYTLTVALLIPVSGWLADRFGTQRVFRIAIFIFTLGSLFCGLSTNLEQLIASRILQAVGGSMMVPVARLVILYAYPKEKLLQVINFITIPAMVGPVIGPTVGGFLVEYVSWHWIFLINIPIGIAVVWLASYSIPNFVNKVKRLDYIGLLLFGGGLSLLTLLLELTSSDIISVSTALLLLLLAVGLLLLYGWRAKRIDYPLIDLDLFKIRTLRISVFGNIATRLGIGGLSLLIPLMLQVGFGYPAFIAGMIMIPFALSNLIGKSFVVPVVTRLGYKRTLIGNTLLLGTLIASFYFLRSTTPLYVIVGILLVHGLINSVQFTAMNTLALADLTKDNSSEGNSLLAVTQQLAVSFGISIASFILLFFQNTEKLQVGEESRIFNNSFLVLGIITILSTLVFMQLKTTDGENLSRKKQWKEKRVKKVHLKEKAAS